MSSIMRRRTVTPPTYEAGARNEGSSGFFSYKGNEKGVNCLNSSKKSLDRGEHVLEHYRVIIQVKCGTELKKFEYT